MSSLLTNYKQLIARVDTLCNGIAAALGAQITCTAGCSSCCAAITVFPVEAAAMREVLQNMPDFQANEIRRHVSEHIDDECCPLLYHHRCLLYDVRPIICRTHGLPIVYTSTDGRRASDCCPHNMTEAASVSGASVVDLDKLNILLAAVNSIYRSQAGSGEPERLTIAEIIIKSDQVLQRKQI